MDEKACALYVLFVDPLTLFTDPAYTNPPRAQGNASSPPPINWNTRPKGYKQDLGTPNGSQGAASIAMTQAESVTDDSGDRRQLELLLHHFSHAIHIASGRNVDNQQDGVDIPITTSNQIEHQDTHGLQDKPLDLTTAFSNLSTSNDPAPLVPRAPPGFPPYSSTFQPSPLLNAKYYVIVKGKCTGVYYGGWYAYISFQI